MSFLLIYLKKQKNKFTFIFLKIKNQNRKYTLLDMESKEIIACSEIITIKEGYRKSYA